MTVTVKAPARLHFGFLDLNGELGRLYGSLGMAIDRPQVILKGELIEKSRRSEIETRFKEAQSSAIGPTEVIVIGEKKARVLTYARRFLECFPLPGIVSLKLEETIPAHVGLGSGTQLSLAVGTALAQLAGIKTSVQDLALIMGRGVHSGIGIGTFQYGGFIVDGGHAVVESNPKVPPIIFQHPVPRSWILVIAIPSIEPGFAGLREKQAFQSLPPAPPSLPEKICRLLLVQMLPALKEGNLKNFAQALTVIQQLVGECFAPVQGGRFANSVSAELIEYWLEQGVYGAGQSSWGPTVYALVDEEGQAAALLDLSKKWLAKRGGGEVFLARSNNQGASVIEG